MKRSMKALLGPVYPFYIRVRTSGTARDLTATTGLPAYLWHRRQAPGSLAIDIDARMGLGGVLTQALLFHALAEEWGVEPLIVSSNPLYAGQKGRDFLGRYFDRQIPPRGAPKPIHGNSYLWALRKVAPATLSLTRASELFARHFQPTALVRDQIAKVKAGRDRFDLSVHYRGTDKFLETAHVSMDRMFAAVDRALTENSRSEIFLATDDAAFDAAFRARYARHAITTYNLDTAPPGVPRHFSDMAPEIKALEAVVNIFLLADAPLCIRTSSYLSALSRIASPELRTETVNEASRASLLFPESEVLAAEGAPPMAKGIF